MISSIYVLPLQKDMQFVYILYEYRGRNDQGENFMDQQ